MVKIFCLTSGEISLTILQKSTTIVVIFTLTILPKSTTIVVQIIDTVGYCNNTVYCCNGLLCLYLYCVFILILCETIVKNKIVNALLRTIRPCYVYILNFYTIRWPNERLYISLLRDLRIDLQSHELRQSECSVHLVWDKDILKTLCRTCELVRFVCFVFIILTFVARLRLMSPYPRYIV